jgi:hypothetical protein
MSWHVVRALVLFGVLFACAAARADSIFGSCVYKDGSKAGGEVSISTSWNSQKAYPANGRYVLDFGGKVDHDVTIYVNGTTFGRVHVHGTTRVDLVVP